MYDGLMCGQSICHLCWIYVWSVNWSVSQIVIGQIYISVYISQMVGQSVCWSVKWSSVSRHCTGFSKKVIYISKYALCPASFFGQQILNKTYIVRLDGARPANTCIPPYFPGNGPTQPHCIPNHPKSTFLNLKK